MTCPASELRIAVVVLCGGKASRFNPDLRSRDKTAAQLGDSSILSRLVGSLPCRWPIVAVGPIKPLRDALGLSLPHTVRWCRERPRHGGPIAALTTALSFVHDDEIALVGGDMPFAGEALPALVDTLLASPHADAVVGVTPDGRVQPLLLAARTTALRDALAPRDDHDGDGAAADGVPRSMRELLARLRVLEVPVSARSAADVDTPEDLTLLHHLLDETAPPPA